VGGWCEATVLAIRDRRGLDIRANPNPPANDGGTGAGGDAGGDGYGFTVPQDDDDIAALLNRTEFFVHFKGWSSDLDSWVAAPTTLASLHTHTRRWREALRVGSVCEANFGASARGRCMWRIARVVYVSRAGPNTKAVCVRYEPSERDGGSPPFTRFWLDVSCDRLCSSGTHVTATLPPSAASDATDSSTEGSSDEGGSDDDRRTGSLAKLWRTNTLTDFVVHVGDSSFQVHKIVLAARSEVFRSMLTLPLREACENEVTLDDICPKTFERILTFLYTGKVDTGEDSKDSVTSLFTLILAADRFDIKELMEKCENVLKNCIDVDNVVKVTALARRFKLQRLEEVASDFFVTYARRVLKSTDFCNLLTHVPIELDDTKLSNPLVNSQENPVKRTAPADIEKSKEGQATPGFRAAKRQRSSA